MGGRQCGQDVVVMSCSSFTLSHLDPFGDQTASDEARYAHFEAEETKLIDNAGRYEVMLEKTKEE
jgi:hypothetical protein